MNLGDKYAYVEKAYLDQATWNQKAIINTACSGKFSSDRTIKQYADEIWGLTPLYTQQK